MSSASSCASSHGAMASRLRTLALGAKPHINIVLDNERSSYSTLDKLSGKVEIAVSHSTRFDDIEIQFIGTTKTFLEKMATTPGLSGGMSAFHQFLKLRQPIQDSCYPQPRILEPGRTYEFPFLFVVPQHLLPRVCRHEVHHESVRDCHLQLPPSLGTITKHDDLGPDMAKIQYQIAARITATNDIDNTQKNLATKMKTIRIIPTVEEQPPVNVLGPDSDYILRTEKSIKKGVFKGKLGTLVIEAEQPRSLRLPKLYDPEQTTVSTVTTIKLRFDPVDVKSQPPRLGSLSSKLKVSTWYATGARMDIPKKKDSIFDHRQGLHSVSIPLSSRCMGSVEWTSRKESALEEEWLARRDSGLSHQEVPKYPSPSTNYKGHGFWTAEIVVPVALPKDKHFVPTFHSCLTSRTYSLNLSLGIHSAGVGFPSVDLKLPLQISAEGKGESDIQSRNSLTVEEQLEEMRVEEELLATEHRGSWSYNDLETPEFADLPPEYEAYRRPIVGVAG
ncbi:hypothetical protein D6C85_04405 [Aureobasidium pullulans]|uniref:Arrestin-like N-terminal domain-containing protein n=1 Tax=Aureobasidium pullulans TaxID=5580 RepID=A0A4S8ZGB4_AURPU|nr:hypothetical protein D6D27_06544 [Aureobasidium pullulans]THW64875.1 hypothetical protein D6D20_02572 [Aureobasidium pullulans]THZ72909.1 hypothetical protein D6C85_04405 [Aureobasidium pullulans]